MSESSDIFGDEPEEAGPSAAEREAAGQESMFAAPAAPPPAPAPGAASQPYRVLARKYRPQTFAELIGQDAMVQTLGNAIRRERLAHAFLMTGVRGVGKTSTARLIAKALNCIGPDGQGGPTIDPCGRCEACVAIAEGRHIDVIEMDAASHNGIDDVRAMTDAVRYAAVSARYKIYIIDEVHMMSKPAFNALLKTLEEPPGHVKFLFATTEADKLPVTVLSRCQRFDLRRVSSPQLAAHFARVCEAEGVAAEDEALALIAAASEGSVRDGLSILDQAIAHSEFGGADLGGQGRVSAAQVQDMLGLADKSAQRRLFAAMIAGDSAALLDLIDQQFALGVEPLALLRAAMELVHRITVAQLGKSGADAVSAEERAALEEWAGALSAGQLHRLWQLLLKGHDEVRGAPDPLIAAKMALLRVQHASDLPDPGLLVKKLEELASRGALTAPAAPGAEGGTVAAAPAPPAIDWAALVEQIGNSGFHGDLHLAQTMHSWVRVVRLEDAMLDYDLVPGLSEDPGPAMRDALLRITGIRWEVARKLGEGRPSLREAAVAASAAGRAALLSDPLVEATMAAFPGAELIETSADARVAAPASKWRA